MAASSTSRTPSHSLCHPKKSLRTFDEIKSAYIEERRWFHEEMPVDPFPSLEEVVDALNDWAQSRSTCGGGFAINKDTANDSSGKRGRTRKLICDRAGFPRPKKIDANSTTTKRNTRPSKKI